MRGERPTRTRLTETAPSSVEEQLTQLDDQFRVLKAQVRQAQQLASLGTAAAMIAHEVNNLLTPIYAYAKAALAADDPDLREKALRVTVKNVRMLVAMSERVLEISAAKPPVFELFSVRAVAEDAVESLCRDLSKDGIAAKLKIDASLRAWADPLNLQQVLFNLLLNARDAMAPSHSGRLTVTAERRGDRVVMEVSDTGVGIEPDRLGEVFNPLETSKQIRRDGRQRCGGLGLALCRDMTEENGGTISVASEPGVGTTFTITLPAAKPRAK